ncbi:MAG: TIGR02300 family protein [Pseudomonadota bacterium]
MPKDEWGVKRICPSCSMRFYDLQNNPMTCPNCGAEFDLESLTAKKTSARPEKKEAVAETEADEVVVDDVVLDDDDDDSGDGSEVDIDDELLEDDDDDDTVNLDEIADVPAEEDDS